LPVTLRCCDCSRERPKERCETGGEKFQRGGDPSNNVSYVVEVMERRGGKFESVLGSMLEEKEGPGLKTTGNISRLSIHKAEMRKGGRGSYDGGGEEQGEDIKFHISTYVERKKRDEGAILSFVHSVWPRLSQLYKGRTRKKNRH